MSATQTASRREAALAALGYALLTALAFPGVVLGRGAPAVHDLLTHHVPWRVWVAEQWLSGHLPLWNPQSANGFPMLAEPQTGALYPPNLLFGLVDPFIALDISILGHVWLAAFGCYLFARGLRFDPASAALTGTVYGASGFLLTHVVYLPMLHACAWIPLLLVGLDRFVRDGRPQAALGAAGAAAAMVLSGHPQAALLGALFAGSYGLYRVGLGYGEGEARKQRLGRAWLLALALGFGGLLVAPQLVATLELSGESERAGGVDAGFASMGSLPPQELVNVALPRTFGYERPADIPLAHHHHGERYWSNGQTYWENAFFVSVPALLLALLSVVTGARGVRFFAVWAVIALLLMLGPMTPLFALWRLVPGADLLRFPVRFALPFTLAIAVLAGHGLNAWIEAARQGTRRYLWSTRVLAGLLLVLWVTAAVGHRTISRREAQLTDALGEYHEQKLQAWRQLAADPPPGVDPAQIPPPPEGGAAPVTVATTYDGDDYYGRKSKIILDGMLAATDPLGSQVLLPFGMAVGVLALVPLAVRRREFVWGLVLLTAADLLAFGSGFNPAVPWDELRAEPELLAALRADERDDAPPLRVATVERAVPLTVSRQMVGASDNLLHGVAEPTLPSPLRIDRQHRLVSLSGLSIDLLTTDQRQTRLGQRLDLVQALGVTHLQSHRPLPAPYERVADGEVSLYRVPRPWPRASLHRDLPGNPDDPLPSPSRTLPVVTDEPGRLEVDVSGAGAGVVVFTETAYPGWHATVDDEPVDLERAAGALLAVPVGDEARSVSLRYQPRALLVSLAAFPLLWTFWAVWFVMAGARRLGRRRADP